MQTYRRLDDGVRYYGLTVRDMVYLLIGAAILYGAVRLSPFGFKPTFTVVIVLLGIVGALLSVASGNAMTPDRYLAAVIAWRLSPRYLDDRKPLTRGGVVVDAVPAQLSPSPELAAPEWDDELDADAEELYR